MKNAKAINHGLALIAVATLTIPAVVPAQYVGPEEQDFEKMLSEKYKGKSYSPYAARNFPNELLWGDSHLHTGISFDAGTAGCMLMPDDAYRFAKGEEVQSSYGIPVRLSRPLDWLAVTDHTDNMGFIMDLIAGKADIGPRPAVNSGIIRANRGIRKDIFQLARRSTSVTIFDASSAISPMLASSM